MKNIYFFVLLHSLIVCCISTYAQQPDYLLKENAVWTFGTELYAIDTATGLNFNGSNPPMTIGSKLIGAGLTEASVADSNGNLLFYTDGSYVVDATNHLMPYGDSLVADPALYPVESYDDAMTFHTNADPTSSGSQGALIVPVLGSLNKYYIFSLTSPIFYPANYEPALNDTTVSYGHGSELYYSVVDMSLNGGKGDVVSSQRGIFLDSNLSSGLIAIAGTHCDIWVLTHDLDTSVFYAFHITANGIDSVPTVSQCGTFPAYTYFYNYGMAASPDRSKVVQSSFYGADVCSFDNGTGIVSNALRLQPNCPSDFYFYEDTSRYASIYSTCFSPDNSKLYADVYNEVNARTIIFQWNASSNFDSNIQITPYSPDGNLLSTDLALGNDGKIYFEEDQPIPISCIANPNVTGVACNYTPHAADIYPGSTISFGLHNLYVKPIPTYNSYSTFDFDTSLCNATSYITLQSPPDYTVSSWNTGSTDSFLDVSKPGTYIVKSANYCGTRTDTFIVEDCHCSPFIPNAFTPNGKKNEAFHVQFLKGCPISNFELEIYNRWGALVFKTNDISEGWGGNYKGIKQNMDTYMYQMKYQVGINGALQYRKGDITLVR